MYHAWKIFIKWLTNFEHIITLQLKLMNEKFYIYIQEEKKTEQIYTYHQNIPMKTVTWISYV